MSKTEAQAAQIAYIIADALREHMSRNGCDTFASSKDAYKAPDPWKMVFEFSFKCAEQIAKLEPVQVEAKPKMLPDTTRDAPQRVRDIATSMASYIAAIDASSSDVADYIAQRLAPLASHAWTTYALTAIASDNRTLIKAPPPEPRRCGWCNRREDQHNVRHPFQVRAIPVPASVRALASADKAVATPGRCHRVWRAGLFPRMDAPPDGARCTKPADGHTRDQCAYEVKSQLENTLKPRVLLAVDPGYPSAGISLIDAIARSHTAHVMQRDTYEMPREHANPPPGFLPCTRPTPHTGPCAHPPDVNFRWVGESLPDQIEPAKLPDPPRVNTDRRQRALMCAVARAAREYMLQNDKRLTMTEDVFDILENRTADYLTEVGYERVEVDIDCRDALDRVHRRIRVRGLGIEVRYPPDATDPLYDSARIGERFADRHDVKAPTFRRASEIVASRQGGCTRGGEGPACGKAGCRG